MASAHLDAAVARLARLAEVHPPQGDDGRVYLLRVALDTEQRLDQLGQHLHADEIESVADTALPLDDADVWHAWADLPLWTEETGKAADLTERAEIMLRAIGVRLAAAIIAERLAADDPVLAA